MGLDTFPFLEDHTCLITYNNKVYKLKLIYQDLDDATINALSLVCSDRSAHCQIEDAFRAVLYNIEREKQIFPIRTQNFIIYPESHLWPLGQKVFFRANNMPYGCHKNLIQLKIKVHSIALPENQREGTITSSGKRQAERHSDTQSIVQPRAKEAESSSGSKKINTSQQRKSTNGLAPQTLTQNEFSSGAGVHNASNIIDKVPFSTTPSLRTNTNAGSQSPQKASTFAKMLKKHDNDSSHSPSPVVSKRRYQITDCERDKKLRCLADGICEDLGIINRLEKSNESRNDSIIFQPEVLVETDNPSSMSERLILDNNVEGVEQNRKPRRESAVQARKMIKQITETVENDSSSTDDSHHNTLVEKGRELAMQCRGKSIDETAKNTPGLKKLRNISSLGRSSMWTRQKSCPANRKIGFYRARRGRPPSKKHLVNNSDNKLANPNSIALKKSKYETKSKVPKSKLNNKGKSTDNFNVKRRKSVEAGFSDSDFNETLSPAKRRRKYRKKINVLGDVIKSNASMETHQKYGPGMQRKTKAESQINKRKIPGENKKFKRPSKGFSMGLRQAVRDKKGLAEVSPHQRIRFDEEEQDDTESQESESGSIKTVGNESTHRFKTKKCSSNHAGVSDKNNVEQSKNMSHAVKFSRKRSAGSSQTPVKTREEDPSGETDRHNDSLDLSEIGVVEICDDSSIVYKSDKVESRGNNLEDKSMVNGELRDDVDSPRRGRRAHRFHQEDRRSDGFSESDSSFSKLSVKAKKSFKKQGKDEMKVNRNVNCSAQSSFQDQDKIEDLGQHGDKRDSNVLGKSMRPRERQKWCRKSHTVTTWHKKNSFNPRDRHRSDSKDKEDLLTNEKRPSVTTEKRKLFQENSDFVFINADNSSSQGHQSRMKIQKGKQNSSEFTRHATELPQESPRTAQQPLTKKKVYSATDVSESGASDLKSSGKTKQNVGKEATSPTNKKSTISKSKVSLDQIADKARDGTRLTSLADNSDRALRNSKSPSPLISPQAQSHRSSSSTRSSPSPRQSKRMKHIKSPSPLISPQAQSHRSSSSTRSSPSPRQSKRMKHIKSPSPLISPQAQSHRSSSSTRSSTSPRQSKRMKHIKSPSPLISPRAQSHRSSSSTRSSTSPRQSKRMKRMSSRAQASFAAASEKLLAGKDGVWLFGKSFMN